MWKSCGDVICPCAPACNLLPSGDGRLGIARASRAGEHRLPPVVSAARRNDLSFTATTVCMRASHAALRQAALRDPRRTRSPARETHALPSRLFLALILVIATSAFAEIQPADCARAAKYSESKRGVSMLVMQNGRTIFERYANGGSASERWPIFSGTKSFWGIAALAAVQEGLFNLDDPVSDTITEWKSDPRKSQITIRQLLNQTDGIEGASRLQRASIRDRNAVAIQLPTVAEPGSAFIYGPSHLQIFSELLRRKLRGRNVIRYFEAHVSNRLGLRDLNYKKDAQRQSPARDRL